jgi:sugar phosphate isomerase/epimerase
MSAGELGVVLDSFGQPVKASLESASQLGFRRIELPAGAGEVAPDQLARSGRRHLAHYVSGLGLSLSALGADLGGGRFNDSAGVEQRLDRTRQVIEMAAELRVPIVTTHLGRLDDASLKQGYLLEAARQLAEIADRTGTFVSFETASAEPRALATLLKEIGATSVGACYDPASLLIDGHDPIEGIEPLANRILIARIRDAVAGSANRPGHETAIGQGQIDLAAYLAALDQAGYRNTGFLRRTGADRPMQELADAKTAIERIIR